MVVVVLISSWNCASRKVFGSPLITIVTKPWRSQSATRRTQKAKKGARLAKRAARPAKRSKKPIRLLTSLGIKSCEFFRTAMNVSRTFKVQTRRAGRVIFAKRATGYMKSRKRPSVHQGGGGRVHESRA